MDLIKSTDSLDLNQRKPIADSANEFLEKLGAEYQFSVTVL